jgi:hypothetical protein
MAKHSATLNPDLVGYYLCTRQTDQLRRMVAIADRSPARCIFDGKIGGSAERPASS